MQLASRSLEQFGFHAFETERKFASRDDRLRKHAPTGSVPYFVATKKRFVRVRTIDARGAAKLPENMMTACEAARSLQGY